MEKFKCCFIGHRKIIITKELQDYLESLVMELITKYNVNCFIFGSCSEFDDLCHEIVTYYQEYYTNIMRIVYNCHSESAVLKANKAKLEIAMLHVLNKKVNLKDFDDYVQSDSVYFAGKASYVKRNQEMIDASNFCVFYYNKNYEPKTKNQYSSRKSGTRIAYEYAIRKQEKTGKFIINVFEKMS